MPPEMARNQPPIGIVGPARSRPDIEIDLLAGEVVLRMRGQRAQREQQQRSRDNS
jgi:hypothetical protein